MFPLDVTILMRPEEVGIYPSDWIPRMCPLTNARSVSHHDNPTNDESRVMPLPTSLWFKTFKFPKETSEAPEAFAFPGDDETSAMSFFIAAGALAMQIGTVHCTLRGFI
jgi:hypothetical protein